MHAAGCPYCSSKSVRKDGLYRYKGRALQSYECASCKRKFNQRTHTPFHRLRYPERVVLAGVMLQAQMGLSGSNACVVLRNAYHASPHVRTVQRWLTRLSPALVKLENTLQPRFTDVWMVDELFANRHAHNSQRKPNPMYLYTVLDSQRQVVACLVSKTRDADTVVRLLNLAVERAGLTPRIISRDGCNIYDTAKRRMWMKLKGTKWVNAHFKAVAIPVTRHQRVVTKRRGPITRIRRSVVKVTQNHIERYHCTPRMKENCMRGIKTPESGTITFQAVGVTWNLLKGHAAHQGKPPAVRMGWSPEWTWDSLATRLAAP